MAYITINRAHYFHNLTQLALKAGSKEKIAVVLKDNAYGHGLELMARLSAEFGIKKAVVRTLDEAQKIYRDFDDILILADTPVVDKKLRFALNDLAAVRKACKGARVDLKVDTGMHRNGIAENELESALQTITKKGLKLVGVMTHYRSADELSSEYMWQKKRFEALKTYVCNAGFDVAFHSHNTAALMRCGALEEDFARVGIGAYGLLEIPSVIGKNDLKPVLSLWAKRLSMRMLKKGERVGYGGDFFVSKDTIASTYDVGYGDGLRRGDAKHPLMTAEGLSILGRVSMDSLSLATDKDEVCIFNDARAVAKHFGTISYEIVTALSPMIRREVV